MLTIEDRINESLDYLDKAEYEKALTPVSIAVDMTAQKIAGKPKSAKSDYKKFVTDHLWLITYLGFPGLLSSTLKIPFKHPDIPTPDGFITIEDIVYHVIRCELVHSTGLHSNIVWNGHISLGIDHSGKLVISTRFVAGLIGSVVFSPINSDCKSTGDSWLSIADFKYFLSDCWGRIDIPKKVIKRNAGIIIP